MQVLSANMLMCVVTIGVEVNWLTSYPTLTTGREWDYVHENNDFVQ
jgi:hypothetical protein